MSDLPLPEITPLTEPYWASLSQGRLVFQSCRCGHRWLPPRPECPNCLEAGGWKWQEASGEGKLISWVVYHTAYHPAFADLTPYNVALVELLEGPRMITNILCPNGDLKGDMPLRLSPRAKEGFVLSAFIPV